MCETTRNSRFLSMSTVQPALRNPSCEPPRIYPGDTVTIVRNPTPSAEASNQEVRDDLYQVAITCLKCFMGHAATQAA